jgi:hypothetical protein
VPLDLQDVAPSPQVNHAKGIILFLHGVASSEETWEPMLKLLDRDPRITTRYEFAAYSYPTKFLELNPLARIPELSQLGGQLESKIDLPEYRDRSLTLVGHSQGGLIIQSYFAKLVGDGHAEKLSQIRQAIFFATPSEGSSTASVLRSFLAQFIDNPQERTLQVLNLEVAKIRARIRRSIVDATTDSDKTWRVPIHAFYGLQDNIVPEASAQGVIDDVQPLEGTHTTVHVPRDADDDRFKKFAQLLLDPGGHAHRFEVEEYCNVLRVEPRDGQTMRTRGRQQREIGLDNFAQLTRTVKFAAANSCADMFKITYDVRSDSYIEGVTDPENEVPAEERNRNEGSGTSFEYRFRPRERGEHTAWLKIYNGFGQDQRNIHFHLDSYESHMRLLSYELDLSAYLEAGYELPEMPSCRYSPVKATTCEFCDGIRMRPPRPITARPRDGVFIWEFPEKEGGVVDIVWEVTKSQRGQS